MVIEICANSVSSCIEAEKGGAQRVELCAALPEGGTTPSWGEIVVAREAISIDLNVIIRPRSGDFLYNEVEFRTMLQDIEAAKRAGADGVVFGCLNSDGTIDMERNRELILAAEEMSKTFHRAFDVCCDPMQSLEDIIELGFDRILTSGQEQTAIEGVELLRKLVEQAGDRIIIMAGSGVNASNIAEIRDKTGVREFHFSARHDLKSCMKYHNEKISMGGVVKIDENMIRRTSSEIVRNAISKVLK